MIWLALALIALLVYTYAGYPLVVALLGRAFPRAVRTRQDYEPSVSVCMAVHDGAEHLPRKLESLEALDYPPAKLEFLIHDDGSSDESAELVRRFAENDGRFRLSSGARQLGKPSALNRLRASATGEVLVFTDVRQQLSENAVRELVRPLADASVGCVAGNLVLVGTSGAGAYWRYERFIRGSEGMRGRMVGVSGALYALRREDMPELAADVILDDMFVPLSVALGGKHIVFAEGARAFDHALDDEREFSRKARTLAGNYQLVSKLPGLLRPEKNRVWFELVSHKLLRLVCPWALVALAVVTLVASLGPGTEHSLLELELWRALALGQLLFYALALVGPVAGRAGVLARTFVVLNAAAVAGLWRFVRGTQSVTWKTTASH